MRALRFGIVARVDGFAPSVPCEWLSASRLHPPSLTDAGPEPAAAECVVPEAPARGSHHRKCRARRPGKRAAFGSGGGAGVGAGLSATAVTINEKLGGEPVGLSWR